MKTLALFLTTVFLNINTFSQTPGPEMTFDKETHDYGTVEQNGDGDCSFTITNTGSEPLIITNAVGSCQCTVPTWPKEPIQPGKSATIKVHYNTSRLGAINKTVTISSNDVHEPVKRIYIKGTVVKSTQTVEK